MGKDYGNFTDSWFDGGLVKASLVFPRLVEGEDGEWTHKFGRQTITEAEKLERLSKLFGSAIRGHEALSGCPYMGVLDLEREDGETLQMFVAADSCDSITYEGRIGFEYGKQQDLAQTFSFRSRKVVISFHWPEKWRISADITSKGLLGEFEVINVGYSGCG